MCQVAFQLDLEFLKVLLFGLLPSILFINDVLHVIQGKIIMYANDTSMTRYKLTTKPNLRKYWLRRAIF
jgi:hypothetical protein